jgi:hypothetical protein
MRQPCRKLEDLSVGEFADFCGGMNVIAGHDAAALVVSDAEKRGESFLQRGKKPNN